VTPILTGFETSSALGQAIAAWSGEVRKLHRFELLDDAIEWAEDQVIYRYGGFVTSMNAADLSQQALLTDLSEVEVGALAKLSMRRTFHMGERIIRTGEAALSIFFLLSGMVSVKLPSGVRLASLGAGMEFGEMAINERIRSADVWADSAVECLELPLAEFATFRSRHPEAGHKIMANLARLLARRLILANAKVELLSAG